MKKLYTLLAAAATFVGANAQLYFVGNGEGLAWEPTSPKVVELVDGAYTVTINNLVQFKMSTVQGGWDDFNAGALWATVSKDQVGTPVELTNNQADFFVPWTGDWTITVPADLSTVTLTTATPEVPSGPAAVFIRGDMNGWLNDADDATKALWQMETTDGKEYWFDCQGETTIYAGVAFKIADASWGQINYSGGDTLVEGEFETEPQFNEWYFNQSTNSKFDEDYTGTILMVLPDVQGDPAQVALFPVIVEHTTGVADVMVDSNAAPVYYNLQGVRVAQPENGLFIVVRGNKVAKELVK